MTPISLPIVGKLNIIFFSRSLFKDPTNVPEFGKEIRKITWIRPSEISKDPKFMTDKEGDAK